MVLILEIFNVRTVKLVCTKKIEKLNHCSLILLLFINNYNYKHHT